MPTVISVNGFRFFFYSNDHDPMHIHVEKENKTAKFNINPIELVRSSRFNANELRKIRILIEENLELFKDNWNDYFNS